MENNYKKIIKEYFEHRKIYDKAVFIFFEKYPEIKIYLNNILLKNQKWQTAGNIFTNNEMIDYSKPLDCCLYQVKQIEGYNLEIIPPEIIIKNKFQIENCGYLKYTKLN